MTPLQNLLDSAILAKGMAILNRARAVPESQTPTSELHHWIHPERFTPYPCPLCISSRTHADGAPATFACRRCALAGRCPATREVLRKNKIQDLYRLICGALAPMHLEVQDPTVVTLVACYALETNEARGARPHGVRGCWHSSSFAKS